MIRLVRKATLLVALSVLTPATAVYAECAWALWLQKDSSPWGVLHAFSTREGCIEAMSQQVAAAEKRNPRVTLDTIGGSFIANAKGRSLRGQCLPDTIDPRGAKGE
jgi:hypothetical protein